MSKKEILYFEEDDASELGANGKQVFVAKRINGKTAKNKIKNQTDEENKYKIEDNQQDEEKREEIDDIFSGVDRFYISNEPEKKKNKKYNEIKQVKTVKEVKSRINEKKKNNSKIDIKSNSKTKKTKNQTKKMYTNKKRRKKIKTKTKKRLLSIGIIIVLFLGMIVFALVSPIFNIETIIVNGNKQVSQQTIISLSKLQIGTNIFKNIDSQIIGNIKENHYIDDVKVRRILPNVIEINVEEREIAYQVKVIDAYVYVDYEGYILETSSQKQNVPLIEGFNTIQDNLLNGDRLCSEDIVYLNIILNIIDNAKKLDIYSLINKIIIENDEYILYLKNDNKYVYLGDGNDITNKMLYVQAIIEKEKGIEGRIFIDGNLDDGFKPYFREESIK